MDYKETYAPVVRHESVRIILATAAALDLEIIQLDVKTAFLNGELEEDIYMEQPEGYRTGDPIKTACKLKKSLCGLKQSSRTWNSKFNELIVKMDFIRNVADPCMYHRKESNGRTILAIRVDDGLLCCPGRT